MTSIINLDILLASRENYFVPSTPSCVLSRWKKIARKINEANFCVALMYFDRSFLFRMFSRSLFCVDESIEAKVRNWLNGWQGDLSNNSWWDFYWPEQIENDDGRQIFHREGQRVIFQIYSKLAKKSPSIKTNLDIELKSAHRLDILIPFRVAQSSSNY